MDQMIKEVLFELQNEKQENEKALEMWLMDWLKSEEAHDFELRNRVIFLYEKLKSLIQA